MMETKDPEGTEKVLQKFQEAYENALKLFPSMAPYYLLSIHFVLQAISRSTQKKRSPLCNRLKELVNDQDGCGGDLRELERENSAREKEINSLKECLSDLSKDDLDINEINILLRKYSDNLEKLKLVK